MDGLGEGAALAAGITPQHHQALLAIKGFPGRERITRGELAERLQLRPHSVVGWVNRLAAEKYVQRVPSATDRRQVFVELSERGEQVLGRLSRVHRQQLQQMGPELRACLSAP